MNLTPFLRRLGIARSRPRETPMQLTGRMGEERAALFLRREKKFRIIVRNWCWQKGEIDLVCWDRDILVFVEVKTRAAEALVPGYYAVDARKKEALRRAFGAYLKGLRRKPTTFRFDVVEVSVAAGRNPQILHFENVPLFPKGYHW